jgi:hypothetical protein
MKPTQAQQRHDAIEILRNQLRPQKAYEVTKPTAPSVNIIDGTINGHGVKFIFFYQPTKADMANAHHATKNLENNLRDGVKPKKAHLFNLLEPSHTDQNMIDQEPAVNSKNLEQLKHESEVEHELGTN